MAGKTGTAQKISRKGNVSFDPHSLPYNLRHQALFVGYAPADNPTIVIAISVEHGGFGGSTAAPIARKVFDAWLLGKMPEPVPTDPKYKRPDQPHAAPVVAVAATQGGPVASILPGPAAGASPAGKGVGVSGGEAAAVPGVPTAPTPSATSPSSALRAPSPASGRREEQTSPPPQEPTR